MSKTWIATQQETELCSKLSTANKRYKLVFYWFDLVERTVKNRPNKTIFRRHQLLSWPLIFPD